MQRITLRYPDLPELAQRSRTDLPDLLGLVSPTDQSTVLEAERICNDWVGEEFPPLITRLQLEKRLPPLDTNNVDATSHDKRVMTYEVTDGAAVEVARETIKAAWDATCNAAAEAFYIRVKEIVDGHAQQPWDPHQAVGYPTI